MSNETSYCPPLGMRCLTCTGGYQACEDVPRKVREAPRCAHEGCDAPAVIGGLCTDCLRWASAEHAAHRCDGCSPSDTNTGGTTP